MIIEKINLSEAAVISPDKSEDERGLFSRFYCKAMVAPCYRDREIVNVNFSRTLKNGTIRGMHFQYPPAAEMKFVRCIRGKAFDVIVDIRKNSETFLHWFGIELSEKNMKMVLVPEGFAHGFQTLMDNTEMLYLHTANYSPEFEGRLHYLDPAIGITWPNIVTDISTKDKNCEFIKPNFKGILL